MNGDLIEGLKAAVADLRGRKEVHPNEVNAAIRIETAVRLLEEQRGTRNAERGTGTGEAATVESLKG